jgi:hypothetical protein
MRDETALVERLEELRRLVERAEREHDVFGVAEGVEEAEAIVNKLARRDSALRCSHFGSHPEPGEPLD